ncbi:unnamed protein product, partial [Polarella glacialis]
VFVVTFPRCGTTCMVQIAISYIFGAAADYAQDGLVVGCVSMIHAGACDTAKARQDDYTSTFEMASRKECAAQAKAQKE